MNKYNSFIIDSECYYFKHKNSLRQGQAFMNFLCEYDNNVYNEIKGTELDCFYFDVRILYTKMFLKERWNETNNLQK